MEQIFIPIALVEALIILLMLLKKPINKLFYSDMHNIVIKVLTQETKKGLGGKVEVFAISKTLFMIYWNGKPWNVYDFEKKTMIYR